MKSNGITLIELLAAMALIAGLVVITRFYLPKASSAAIASRYATTAKNLATAKIQSFKQQSYPFVSLTHPADPPFHISGTSNPGGCDCRQEDPLTFPSPDTVTDNGITYRIYSCINLIYRDSGGSWTTLCPSPDEDNYTNETGLKSIRVKVTWQKESGIAGSSQGSIESESLVNR